MPSPTFPDLSKVNPNDTKAILDALAKLQKELNWLIHTLDSTNIASLTGEKLEPGTVGESQLADGAVTGPKIAALAIGSAHIQDAAITNAKIENGAITNAKIANASIDSAKIANAAVGSAHIQNGAIDSAHIKQGVISNTHIADASITDAKIVSVSANKVSAGTIDTGQVTVQGPNGKLRITSNRLQVFDNQQPAVERVSIGDVNGDGTVYGLRVRGADGKTILYDHNGVYSEGITNGSITNPKIASGAVDNRVIAANTITGDKLVAGSITSREIASNTITGDKLVAGTITSREIAANTITAGSAIIANGAITNAKIANGAIDSAKIASAAIDTAHIKDGAITNAKIANAAIDSAKIANAAIDRAHIKQGVIDGTHIADGSITDAKIVSLTANKIVGGTIDTGQVTVQGPNGKLRLTSNRIQVFDNQQIPVERVSIGDVNGNGTVYGLRVRSSDGKTVLYDHNGVYSEGITNGAITNPKIADGAVDTRVIAANAVTADKIVAGAVTSDKIAANAVTASKIAAGSITTTHISTNGLDASVIKTGTMFFDRIRGGTAELGGAGNGNGLLVLRDSAGTEMIRLDNQGIKLSNGAKLIGDSGVLSVLTFESEWQKAGWWDYGGVVENERALIWAFVPSNFVIVSATLVTKVMSRYLTGWQPLWGTPDGYYTIRSARIYYTKGTSQTAVYDYPASSESSGPVVSGMTDITNALWGSPWNPSAGTTIQSRSNNVISYLTPGQKTVFGVDSGTSTDSTNGRNAAAVQFELTIVGYYS